MKQTSESPFLDSVSAGPERFKSGDRPTQPQELSDAIGDLGHQQIQWPNFAGIVGSSSVMRAVLSRVSKVAPTAEKRLPASAPRAWRLFSRIHGRAMSGNFRTLSNDP